MELSAYFPSENEDKFEPLHKDFHNFPIGKLEQSYSTAIASAELSDHFLPENEDKFKPPHKYFLNSNFVLVRTRL